MANHQTKSISGVIMGILMCCVILLTTQMGSSADEVTLRFMTQWSLEQRAQAFPEIIRKFEAIHPNIKINLTTGFTGYETKIRAEFLSQDPPDIVSMNPYTLTHLVNAGGIYDLTEFYEENGWDEGYFSPVCAVSEKRNGRYYSATGTLSPIGLWYNKGIFEKYGLRRPANWDELMEISEKLNANGIIPLVCNAKDTWAAVDPQALFCAQVTGFDNIMKANAGELPWTAEVFVKPLRIIMDLVESGAYPVSMTGVDMAASISLFSTGKGAMLCGGSWFVQPFHDAAQELKEEGIDFRFGLLDNLEVVSDPLCVLASCAQGPYAVSAKSKHLKEALEYFKFHYQPENQELIAVKAKIMSPVLGVKTSPVVPEEAVESLSALTGDGLFFADYADPAVGDCALMGADIQAMMQGIISPEEVMEKAQKRFEEAHK